MPQSVLLTTIRTGQHRSLSRVLSGVSREAETEVARLVVVLRLLHDRATKEVSSLIKLLFDSNLIVTHSGTTSRATSFAILLLLL